MYAIRSYYDFGKFVISPQKNRVTQSIETHVEEVPGSPPIVGVGTSTAAFIGEVVGVT